jgi:transcription antitermination factor NusG
MFPGYVFCQYSSLLTNKIVDTPGLVRILGFENGPTPIDDSEIVSLQRICDSGVCAITWQYIPVGRKVRITSGPLTDVEGSFVRQRSADRIVVSVPLLGRSVSVDVDGHDVAAV